MTLRNWPQADYDNRWPDKAGQVGGQFGLIFVARRWLAPRNETVSTLEDL